MLSISEKNATQNLFNSVRKDCQSNIGTTCERLCSIMLTWWMTKISYYILPDHKSWRIREISETKTGKMVIENFTKDELASIKEFACCIIIIDTGNDITTKNNKNNN